MDKEQQTVLAIALDEAKRSGATPREQKALVEALLVESDIRNLPGGDADSQGALQQRPSQGWKHPRNVRLAVRDFLTHARALRGHEGTAGQLAQGVQRSAFPGKYDERSTEAKQLLGGSSAPKTGVIPGIGNVGSSFAGKTVTKTDPNAVKRVALANYLTRSNPHSLLLRTGAVSVDEPTTTTTTEATPPASASAGARIPMSPTHDNGGTTDFEGMKVASWIAPALAYARHHGWKGKVRSGFRTLAEQTTIYNSGVRPAAKPGTSNHEGADFPRGAVDVSDAAQLSDILRRSPYATKLQWAGPKDPVHFSHPHNGSY